MAVWEIILGALLIIASLIMIIVIILQEGNQQGVGVVSGGADTFFSQNKARTYDKFLATATKWVAIGFVVVVLALNVITYFVNGQAKAETAEDSTSASETIDADANAAVEVVTEAATEAASAAE